MSRTVLLIEDNAEMAENISSILELANYQVQTAPNGKIGVELALNKPPDLILCDIMMPELDGYGVLHILNANPATKRIPFVFITAKADKEHIRMGMNLGADDYITKPFDGFDLLKMVEIRLGKHATGKPDLKTGEDVAVHLNTAEDTNDFNKVLWSRPSRFFRKKEFIFIEGQTATDLFMIKRGKVKTYKINSYGKEFITGIHAKGEFIGYVSLLGGKPHNENAEVLEESEIIFISKQDFINLVYTNKDVAKLFFEVLSNNLAQAENRLLDLAHQSVREKVAGALLKLAESNGQLENPLVSISRKDLSAFVGTATESLNRTLADFKDEGLIEVDGHGLHLLNSEKLKKLTL